MDHQHILSETLGRKLYSKKAVMIGTMLGGPLAGAYLLAKNFKTVNKSERVAQAWTIGIIAFFVLILLGFFILEQVPNFLFIFFYAWMGHFAAEKMQGDFLDKHEEEGGTFYSNWRAAGIGVIAAAIFLALLFGVLFLAGIGSGQ